METTYIKLDRSLLTHRYFHDLKILQVWIWCLLKASHAPHKMLVGFQTVELEVGQFVTGRASMAKELCMAPSTAYRYLRLIKSDNKLLIKSNNRFSVITVIDFGAYQIHGYKSGQVNEQQMSSGWTASEQQVDTNKKGKNVKNGKEVIKPSSSSGDNGKGAFATFWSVYPRKIGKGSAEKAWKKIKQPAETLPSILSALSWQKETEQWRRNNGQYIPHPATYLNQRRWEDELGYDPGGSNRLDRIFGGESGSGIS